MNCRERLKEIIDFLRPYQRIWQNEIMLLYPTFLEDYPRAWVDELLRFNQRQDLICLERKEALGLIQEPSLINYYERRKELISIPFSPEYPPMPENHYTFLYVIPKKQHEIRRLAPLLNALYQKGNIHKLVDIGGGIGILAQTLSNEYGHRVCSVDLDPVMQETGKRRNAKNARDKNNLVDYRNVKVEVGNSEFSELITPETMTVGLHTCGPLAVAQIVASAKKKAKGLVNFGCCYHKMDERNQNISEYVKGLDPLFMNQFALTLASRAHLKLPEKDFDFKLKVKHFRYALHFLLYDQYGIKEQVTLGNSARELYHGPFSAYVLEQLRRLGIASTHTSSELDEYYLAPERQDLIKKMLAAGIIRDTFGRALELYILLDRAVYLEEQGHEVDLYQCFDEVISPRNLGIFAYHVCSHP